MILQSSPKLPRLVRLLPYVILSASSLASSNVSKLFSVSSSYLSCKKKRLVVNYMRCLLKLYRLKHDECRGPNLFTYTPDLEITLQWTTVLVQQVNLPCRSSPGLIPSHVLLARLALIASLSQRHVQDIGRTAALPIGDPIETIQTENRKTSKYIS